MITIRCTKKLFRHLGREPDAQEAESTSSLGDWFANLVAVPDGPSCILATNERSLLSVVLADTSDLVTELPRRVIALLRRLEMPPELVEREAFHLRQLRFGKTNNRRVLGSMNDAVHMLEAICCGSPPAARLPAEEAEDRLAENIYSMIDYQHPSDVARQLLGVPPRPRLRPHLAPVSASSRSDTVARDGRLSAQVPADPQVQAQDLIYKAWETADRRRRVVLARQALAMSPNCADAYVLLAEEASDSPQEAIETYRKGVEASERALGRKAFSEYVGHFWGVFETRPYMRARAGLARSLWEAGEHDSAIAHYRDMLRLNPRDNQGLRYVLLGHLLEQGRDAEASALQQQYEDDGAASWTYSKALLCFREAGDTADSRKALAQAVESNSYVPDFLLGRKKIPARRPDYIGFGDEREAIVYAADSLTTWSETKRALAWLRSQT